MADALKERTTRLLTDYLEYCAREPGTPARAPSTPEAAVLRSVAAQVLQRHERFLSHYRGYRGNRVELVAQVEREILAHPQPLSWGRVVALLTFAGTLLEGSPSGIDQEQEPGDWEATVRQDCERLVDFLCNRLTGQYRAWLEAHDGWDGFCLFFTPMLPSWKRMLVQALLSCFTAVILIYFWKRLSRLYRRVKTSKKCVDSGFIYFNNKGYIVE
ncbi:PREDICTED: bcl-2-like protein 10 [Odobenus rosmarus divergens]|uniref:Bcl-2-like protein 10 n=1 Tax=Odobenus rosmarus divergens TaxID=9708 RepID=A0A2U3VNG7_ODORO|nr:PREDICTED: bcl-2-like protein 10 [Odobenus rosmarus divergens]